MSVNSSVNKQLEKMFDVFNKEFFDAELETPLFRLESNCNKDGAFISDAVINQGKVYSHEIVIPVKILNEDIEKIAVCLLHNMIHYYAFINDFKVCSRGDSYHNKKFKSIADFCGLTCKYDRLTGWITSSNSKFSKLCKSYGFSKTWSNRYTADKKKPGNNSKRYVCPCCKTIIRATHYVNVICAECNEKFILQQ